MHLTCILLIFTSALARLSVLAATTQKIVSTNQVLRDVCVQSDKDVVAVKASNGLTKAEKVTTDLEDLVYDLEQSYAADQGIPPTSDPGTEDSVADSFNDFNSLDDLQNKEPVLTIYGQKSTIYDQLEKLNPAYTNYAGLVINDLGDQDHKNEVSEFAATGSGKIVTTAQEFQS